MWAAKQYQRWKMMNPDHQFFIVSSFVVAFLCTMMFFVLCVVWEDHPSYLTLLNYPLLSPVVGLCVGEMICSIRDWYAVRHGFDGVGSRDSLIVSLSSILGAALGSVLCYLAYLVLS